MFSFQNSASDSGLNSPARRARVSSESAVATAHWRHRMLSIAIWNSQGNPSTDRKQDFLYKLLDEYDIVFLQECGTLVGTSLQDVTSVAIGTMRCEIRGAQQAGALNPRCSDRDPHPDRLGLSAARCGAALGGHGRAFRGCLRGEGG